MWLQHSGPSLHNCDEKHIKRTMPPPLCQQRITLLCQSAGAFVQGSSVLSWAANNTAKLGLQHPAPYPQMQCWTLISTNTYGQANKVAQEKVPADVAAKVTGEMLDAFSSLLGPAAAGTLPKAVFTRCGDREAVHAADMGHVVWMHTASRGDLQRCRCLHCALQ
jgi:hypothetical protein